MVMKPAVARASSAAIGNRLPSDPAAVLRLSGNECDMVSARLAQFGQNDITDSVCMEFAGGDGVELTEFFNENRI